MGPDDPKTETWQKVRKALGLPADVIKETRSTYNVDEKREKKIQVLVDRLRSNPAGDMIIDGFLAALNANDYES